jgi:hypothetical protein
MRNLVPALAVLALVGSGIGSNAFAQSDPAPNGGGRDASKTAGISSGPNQTPGTGAVPNGVAMDSDVNPGNGSEPAPNGGGRDASKTAGISSGANQAPGNGPLPAATYPNGSAANPAYPADGSQPAPNGGGRDASKTAGISSGANTVPGNGPLPSQQ